MKALSYVVEKEANRSRWCCFQNSINQQQQDDVLVLLLILFLASLGYQIQSRICLETDSISYEDRCPDLLH